jgi:hypothetical protein
MSLVFFSSFQSIVSVFALFFFTMPADAKASPKASPKADAKASPKASPKADAKAASPKK